MSAAGEAVMKGLPAVPEGAPFKVLKCETVGIPHPYCITPKHVAWASDHCGGMLGAAAIREAEEKAGASCEICRKQGGGILKYDDHESPLTLFVAVPHHDLNAIPGLHAYLMAVKAAGLGVQGFAFPLVKP